MIVIPSFVPDTDLRLIDDIDTHGITIKDHRHEDDLGYYLISIDFDGLIISQCISGDIYDVDEIHGSLKLVGVDEL
jgi:hypothetical protein